jgi:oligopeptidase B
VHSPPEARRRPTRLEAHGDIRVDEWYWLRDRDDPEVLAYLEAENLWTEESTAHTAALRDALFTEIKGRIQETDVSAPVGRGRWWYYSRTVEGLQYPIHCRRPRATPDEPASAALDNDAAEQVVIDENVLAEGHAYFALGALEVTPNHTLVAYSTDVEGDEVYTMRFRDLTSGTDLPDEIAGTYYGTAWAADSATLFYTTVDESNRPWRVHRHRLGTGTEADVLVHQEDDERFHVGLGRTRSEAWVVIDLHSAVTSEVRVVPTAEPDAGSQVIAVRRHGIEYSLEHQGDRFLLVTNDGAANFRLVEAPVGAPGPENWRDVVSHRPDVRLYDVDAFARHLVLHERTAGLTQLRVLGPGGGDGRVIDQPEPVHTVSPGANPDFDASAFRFHYTSLVTPSQAVDYDLDDGSRTIVKQQPVLGYEPTLYRTERRWAEAPDGTAVPISLAYRRDRPAGGPALLYGYGAYEHSVDPHFSSLRLGLLDRGFVYAVAHVRGGGELGRRWYEDGKLLHKRQTFADFVACAEHLVGEGLTTPAGLVARGASAGGLLTGAAVNLRPDLFRAVVAEVPFVDCLTTMLDPSLPLTAIEWEEWGNPITDAEVYRYIKSYSPYDGVEAKAYPAMLVRAGLNDPRVGYWEPAKWVAKLRSMKSDDNPLLLKTDIGAGHGGPSGRYDAWRDEAFVLAFVVDAVGGSD